MLVRIAARRSHLARIQAQVVGRELEKHSVAVEYIWVTSKGDIDLNTPLHKMPDKGVFTADLTDGLIRGDYDIVVHSWKDLPVEGHALTEIAATISRADCRDVLLFKKSSLNRKTITISSSSPRREYNCKELLFSLVPWKIDQIDFVPIRGNIPTRLEKFTSGDADGIILAKAALDRLLVAEIEATAEIKEMRAQLRRVLATCRFMVLPLSANPSAPAQGALALEVRRDRDDIKKVLSRLNSAQDRECVIKEREVLKSYGGGCHQKIGVSVFNRDFGRVMVLRGQTLEGKKLNVLKVMDRPQRKKISAEKMFPIKIDEATFYERRMLKTDLENLRGHDLWIARSEALPEGFVPDSSKIIWTAGARSWVKLARRGIWVHGCADGLGESEPPNVEALSGRAISFLKLTHTEGSDGVIAKAGTVATYELTERGDLPNLRDKSHFYWFSHSSFIRAVKAFPEILERQHACGPGESARRIEQDLDRAPEIFVSHDEWLQTYMETESN